jgi:16S rRNA (cytosine1402-N4)-methyltransferase
MTPPRSSHTPVLLAEVIAALAPRDGLVYVDGTFGAGGYSRALLEAAECTVWAIDRDPEAIAAGEVLARAFPDRLRLLKGRFGAMERLLSDRGVEAINGIMLDLGVSSTQIDRAARGFSFRFDAPLDMRMEGEGPSAADFINSAPEDELASVIYRYGEERRSRAIARAIVAARRKGRIAQTGELADLVRQVVKRRKGGIDPATRTFQALRIHVNDELGELERGLYAAERLLSPGGRLAVVSYHSLEDRRVKTFLYARAGRVTRPSRHLPEAATKSPQASFKLLTTRVVRPQATEIRDNPRARSARLRAAERTSAAPWPAREAA